MVFATHRPTVCLQNAVLNFSVENRSKTVFPPNVRHALGFEMQIHEGIKIFLSVINFVGTSVLVFLPSLE